MHFFYYIIYGVVYESYNFKIYVNLLFILQFYHKLLSQEGVKSLSDLCEILRNFLYILHIVLVTFFKSSKIWFKKIF